MKTNSFLLALVLTGLGGLTDAAAAGRGRNILLIGGPGGPVAGENDYNGGVLAMQKALGSIPGVVIAASLNGWPADPKAFDNVAAVVLHCPGGVRHPALNAAHNLALAKALGQGAGLVLVHDALEVPKAIAGEQFKQWAGGYFESDHSFAAVWDAEVRAPAAHPVGNGVQPFTLRDEWHFAIRFRERMAGVSPIIYAKPSDDVRKSKPGYPHVVEQSGRPEMLAWAFDRADGGRSVGFTGGHFHANWGNDNFRRLILNGIYWTANMDVPRDGVKSKLTDADLKATLGAK